MERTLLFHLNSSAGTEMAAQKLKSSLAEKSFANCERSGKKRSLILPERYKGGGTAPTAQGSETCIRRLENM